MNRTDRLLGVLLELQRCKRARAEDLAAHFETSKRTIYRDIQALCETGVPIIAQAGRGGLNLGLGLSYNSNVWTRNPGTNTMFYNAERGFPAPGWRLGFGAIQGVNNSGNIGPYTNSITGKASFLYLQPDGTKRDLAYNSTSGK